jgi:WD40 repeat protein
MIMPVGWIGERVNGVALNPARQGRQDGRGHSIRLSLVTWPVAAFLGSTVVAAACLLGDCPFCEKTEPRATLVDQAGAIRSVAFAPDGTLLATIGGDGSLVLRDPAARRGYPLRPAGSDPVRCLAFGPDGKTLATGSRTAAVALYDLDTVESQALDDEAAATAGAAGLAFAPDGSTLAVGQQDGRITLWDAVTGRMRSVLDGHADFVASLAFAPDGATLASAGGDRSVRLWDVAAGRERLAIRGQASTFVALSFSPDNRLLALADQVSPVVRLWDVATGIERAALRGPAGAVVALAISPDGKTLAAAGRQGLVTCWDLATLNIRPMRLRHAGAYSLAFSPDGHTLASAGVDGTVHLWDWPPMGTLRD